MEYPTILQAGINAGPQSDFELSPETSTPLTQNSEMPFEIIHFKEGDTLFKQGEAPRGIYYVHTGCVKLMAERSQSRGRTTTPEYITKLVSPGEYFGYKSIIGGRNYGNFAIAIKPTTVWFYNKELVLRALLQSGPLMKMLLQQAVSDLEANENTTQLHYLASVQERIAYQLVVLADRFGTKTPAGISINLKLTRNELAQLASTINESLSRHLTEFKNEGLIELSGKDIIIKDKQGLMLKSGNFKVPQM